MHAAGQRQPGRRDLLQPRPPRRRSRHGRFARPDRRQRLRTVIAVDIEPNGQDGSFAVTAVSSTNIVPYSNDARRIMRSSNRHWLQAALSSAPRRPRWNMFHHRPTFRLRDDGWLCFFVITAFVGVVVSGRHRQAAAGHRRDRCDCTVARVTSQHVPGDDPVASSLRPTATPIGGLRHQPRTHAGAVNSRPGRRAGRRPAGGSGTPLPTSIGNADSDREAAPAWDVLTSDWHAESSGYRKCGRLPSLVPHMPVNDDRRWRGRDGVGDAHSRQWSCDV